MGWKAELLLLPLDSLPGTELYVLLLGRTTALQLGLRIHPCLTDFGLGHVIRFATRQK